MNLNTILIGSLFLFGLNESKITLDSLENSMYTLKEIENPRVSDIPKSILDTLNKLTENKFELANPNEKFQATDHIRSGKKLPRRQLRCIITNGDSWQIAYIHGGRGRHYHLVECKVNNDRISDLCSIVTFCPLESLKDIESMKKECYFTTRNITSSKVSDKF